MGDVGGGKYDSCVMSILTVHFWLDKSGYTK